MYEMAVRMTMAMARIAKALKNTENGSTASRVATRCGLPTLGIKPTKASARPSQGNVGQKACLRIVPAGLGTRPPYPDDVKQRTPARLSDPAG